MSNPTAFLYRNKGAIKKRLASRDQLKSRSILIAFALVLLGELVGCVSHPLTEPLASLIPFEDTNVVLHNPDMGWVLYENFPLDDNPQGSSTMLTLPADSFPEADAVALMFSWADVEAAENQFDFTRLDRAYDYWSGRGKEIQLRMSTEPLMLHVPGRPEAGTGVPGWLLGQLSVSEKQTRTMAGETYTVVDARNPLYQSRLHIFLQAINRHFKKPRDITVIDLRGFGAWGEWHSGFQYPSLPARRAVLKSILQIWTESLPGHSLALSYSYDPDSPASYHSGPTDNYDPTFTTEYEQFLKYSAFDEALKFPSITFRRDGCGGAVHANERLLNEQAFSRYRRAPMLGEFLGSYGSVREGGSNWVSWMVKDALSLHPNFLNLIGWQGADARAFASERPDLISKGCREMGYRLVPLRVTISNLPHPNLALSIQTEWMNRGVGRALFDYSIRFALLAEKGNAVIESGSRRINTSQWLPGQTNRLEDSVKFYDLAPGRYRMGIGVTDPRSGRIIQLPLKQVAGSEYYLLGTIEIPGSTDRPLPKTRAGNKSRPWSNNSSEVL